MEDIPDTKKLAYAFKLFCVASGKPFLMVADTQKDKHQWMKAIDKVGQNLGTEFFTRNTITISNRPIHVQSGFYETPPLSCIIHLACHSNSLEIC